jgi:hypothetical protein
MCPSRPIVYPRTAIWLKCYYRNCILFVLFCFLISPILQPYHGENKLIFNEMMMRSATNTLSWIFIVLAHWNNSLQIDMSPTLSQYLDSQPVTHSDSVSWFQAGHPLWHSILWAKTVWLGIKILCQSEWQAWNQDTVSEWVTGLESRYCVRVGYRLGIKILWQSGWHVYLQTGVSVS